MITAHNSSFGFLRFVCLALDATHAGYAPLDVQLGDDEEAIFYLNRGSGVLTVNGEDYSLEKGDVLYVGSGKAVRLASDGACDVSEFRAAGCSTRYPVRLVRHRDIEGTPLAADLRAKRPMTKRTVYKLVDQNVEACRLLFGDTHMAQPGGVGSPPPTSTAPTDRTGSALTRRRSTTSSARATPRRRTPRATELRPPRRAGQHVRPRLRRDGDQRHAELSRHHSPPSVDFKFTWCLGSFRVNHRAWDEIFIKPGYEHEW